MPLPPNLRIGPAGWTYSHWRGVVYPKAATPHERPLAFISRYFDLVEVNRTFYQPIRPEVARMWISEVARNPRFTFTVKLHRRFTHDRVLDPAEVETFKEGIRPLQRAQKLGCVLMQFPWTFRFNAQNRDYFIRLRRAFDDFPLVAEMRHCSWATPEAIGAFIDYHVGFCNIDQPPSPNGMPATSQLTTRIGYVRLHGRAAGNTSPHLYLYSEDELRQWTERIAKMAGIAASLFIVTNNDGAGRAAVNALQLARLMGDQRRLAPPDLVRRYPIELQGYGGGSAQRELFGSWQRAVA